MNKTIKVLDLILYVVLCVQIIAFPSLENFYALLISLLGWKTIVYFCGNRLVFKLYPLVSITIVSFALFYCYFPPIATLFELKPVIYNLEKPLLTYTLHYVFAISLVGAFSLFRNLNKTILPRYLSSLNFYYVPSPNGIWIMGAIGLAALMFSNSHSDVLAEDRSAIDRALEGFSFFACVPLIFFSVPKQWKNKIVCKNKVFLYLYMAALLLGAVLTNRRHYIFMYILTPFLIYIINTIVNKSQDTYLIKPKNLIFLGIVSIFLSGPFADFALAMSIQRANVYEIKGEQLLKETWKSFLDKDALRKQKDFFLADQIYYSSFGYTEYYVDNIFLNRFCNMKPIDNSIKYASKIDCTFGNDYMQRKMVEKIEYLLPNPIIKAIDPNFNKFKESSYGFHDYLIGIANNTRGGGYRVGGDMGIGIATFGVFFPFFVILFYSLMFLIINSFSFWNRNHLAISVFAVCKIFTCFYIFQSNHGFMDDISMVLRLLPQQVLLFIIVINVIKKAGF